MTQGLVRVSQGADKVVSELGGRCANTSESIAENGTGAVPPGFKYATFKQGRRITELPRIRQTGLGRAFTVAPSLPFADAVVVVTVIVPKDCQSDRGPSPASQASCWHLEVVSE